MYAKHLKRWIDFIISFCALVILSPVLLLLIVLGFVFMRGNPFFVQERPGKNEKIFKLINFEPWIIEKIRMETYCRTRSD